MSIVPVVAETVFHIGSFPVTNTLINAALALVVFLVVAVSLRGSKKGAPHGLQNLAEMVIEFLLGFFDQVTGDRKKSKKFFPIVGSLFLFILVSNWMGLLPGVGSIGLREESEFIPLFRSANSDLNLTLAMAIFSVVVSHIVGIVTIGFFGHAGKFFQFAGIWKAVKSLKPIDILVSLIEFVVGLIELMSEFAKMASLSLRLFGNVFAGEVLISVIGSLVAFFVPLPFMALEILVGVVQATVFSMLSLVYLTVMTMKPHGAEHEETAHAEHAEAH